MTNADLRPGETRIIEDTPEYQRIVTRSVAGWTETIVYKPGKEPPVVKTVEERLDALEAAAIPRELTPPQPGVMARAMNFIRGR